MQEFEGHLERDIVTEPNAAALLFGDQLNGGPPVYPVLAAGIDHARGVGTVLAHLAKSGLAASGGWVARNEESHRGWHSGKKRSRLRQSVEELNCVCLARYRGSPGNDTRDRTAGDKSFIASLW